MKWRPLLALLLGLVLTLPLVWVFGWLLPGGPRAPGAGTGEEHTIVPRLSTEEQSRLPTFLRYCRRQEDCDAPLICLRGLPRVRPYCAASECETDVDCSEGFSCRSLLVGQSVVRLCGARGQAQEGARCRRLPRRQEEGCAPGLVCAAGWCGRPCHPDEPSSCPQGFFCSTGDVEGPVCLPTCQENSCPEGQQCVRLEQGASVCAQVHGTPCQREPCPPHQVCDVAVPAEYEEEVWMRCAQPCEQGGPPCPEGHLCLAERCRTRCEPGVADTCGPAEVCLGLEGAGPSVCVFDM